MSGPESPRPLDEDPDRDESELRVPGPSGDGRDDGGPAPVNVEPARDEVDASALVPTPFADGHAPQVLVAVLVAWSITIVPAAFGRGVPSVARALALVALAVGLAGPCVAVGFPRPLRLGRALGPRRLGRLLGISLFLALATATWLFSSAAIRPAHLDPARAAIGAVAWGVFALSWSDRWALGRSAPPDSDSPALLARATLPAAAVPIAGAAVLVGVAYTALAWRVRDPARASLAHAVATGCAVWLLSAAATVAIARGKPRPRSARRVTSAALRTLLVLAAVAASGALLLALR